MNRFLFVDTEAITTYMFSLYYHGKAEPQLEQLADSVISRYDIFFLCSDDIPYDDTWDRSGDTNRGIFQKQISAELLRRRIPFITLTGSLETRIRTVSTMLENCVRCDSVSNNLRMMQRS